MDRITNLIQWQRITILVLLLAVLAVGFYADNASMEARRGRSARKALKDFIKVHNNDEVMRQDQEAILMHYEQIIRDKDRQIHQYKLKYGVLPH